MPTLAVAPSVKTPGLYLTVLLLAGAQNPGLAVNRALILASKSSAGNITADTEIRECFGADDVSAALGPGTPGHLAAKKFYAKFGSGTLDVVAPAESAGAAATATQTFTGPATANSTLRARIHGRLIDVPWNSGESVATFVARYVATINGQGDDLFVTAADASPDVTFTAKVKGPWGNDVRLKVSVLDGGSGIGITANPTALTGGTTEPSFANALSLVQTRGYRRMIPCCSNADASSSSATSNPGRVKTHIDTYRTGNQAKLQVFVVGHTGTITNVKAGAVAKNDEAGEYVFGQTFEDLPCELAGADSGDALRYIGIRANFNRIGNKLGLLGPEDVVGEKPTGAEVEDLLQHGVTPLDIEPITNEIFLVRPITTHSLNGSAPDFRALDMPDTDGMYTVAEDVRDNLPIEFANASVTENVPAGSNRLPAGIVEVKDIKGWILSRLGLWVDLGVVDGARLEASVANDELTVSINSSDATQVDIFLPLAIIKPLAKFGVVAAKVA